MPFTFSSRLSKSFHDTKANEILNGSHELATENSGVLKSVSDVLQIFCVSTNMYQVSFIVIYIKMRIRTNF